MVGGGDFLWWGSMKAIVRRSISADRLCQYISDLHAWVRLRSNSHKCDAPPVCHLHVTFCLSYCFELHYLYTFFLGGGAPPQSRLSSAVGFMEKAISFECLQTVQIYFTSSWLAQCSVKQYRCPRSRQVCPALTYGSHPLYLKSVTSFVRPLCGNQNGTGCVNCF